LKALLGFPGEKGLGFGAGGRRSIFLLRKPVIFSSAGFSKKEDAVAGGWNDGVKENDE
jgi:hypothetical protein